MSGTQVGIDTAVRIDRSLGFIRGATRVAELRDIVRRTRNGMLEWRVSLDEIGKCTLSRNPDALERGQRRVVVDLPCHQDLRTTVLRHACHFGRGAVRQHDQHHSSVIGCVGCDIEVDAIRHGDRHAIAGLRAELEQRASQPPAAIEELGVRDGFFETDQGNFVAILSCMCNVPTRNVHAVSPSITRDHSLGPPYPSSPRRVALIGAKGAVLSCCKLPIH